MLKKVNYEFLFDVLLILFVAILILSESQFNELGAVGYLLKIIKFTVIAAIGILSFARNKSAKSGLFVLTFILISALTFNFIFNDGGLSIIPLLLLMWSSKNYSLEKTFIYTFITIALTYLFVMICAALGILKDDVQFLVRGVEAGFFSGEYNRHNYGFLVHNQIAIGFFTLYLFYIAIRRDRIRLYESGIIMALNFVILRLFGSRIVFVLTVLACVCYYIERIIFKHHKKKTISWLAIFAFPVCCILSLVVGFNYTNKSGIYRMLDMLLSNRLRLSHDALSYYGIHLYGAGQYAGTYNSSVFANNTVDNGYISFFIQNGYVAGLIVIGIWTYITYLAVKNNNSHLTLAVVMIAIENLVNPHLGFHLLVPYFCIIINTRDPFLTNYESAKRISNHSKYLINKEELLWLQEKSRYRRIKL